MTFIVTGPEGERKSPGEGPALSLAITLASRLPSPGTVYVRDGGGSALFMVEKHEDKTVTIEGGG